MTHTETSSGINVTFIAGYVPPYVVTMQLEPTPAPAPSKRTKLIRC